MKENKLLLFLILCFFIASCIPDNTQELDMDSVAYRLYQLEKKGWKSRRILHWANNIQYSASEVPVEYYLLKNNGTDDLQKIDSLSKENAKERIVEFEFEHGDKDDLLLEKYTTLDYEKSIQYLATTIQNDFVVVTASNDTIPCAGVHFERHFKVSPFKRVLLYFGGIDAKETIQLIYHDRLYHNGIFKFKFNEIPFKS